MRVTDSQPPRLQAHPAGGEVVIEDLLNCTPQDVQNVYEWLLEKVDAFAATWRDLPEEDTADEGQDLNNIDLFELTDGDKKLRVHAYWMGHLQERVMRDGNPAKAKEGEDPTIAGLVLDWAYGSIVSTSEKARESAKRQLHAAHPPLPQHAWHLLHEARSSVSFVSLYTYMVLAAVQHRVLSGMSSSWHAAPRAPEQHMSCIHVF